MTPIETLKKSESRKKKIILIVVGVLLALYLLPSPAQIARRIVLQRQQAAQAAQPEPTKPSPAPVSQPYVRGTRPTAQSPADTGQTSNLLGMWIGSASLADRPFCGMRLEVRESDEDAPYSGYASLHCAPTNPGGGLAIAQGPAAMAHALNAASAILLGAPKDKSIVFHVKETVGVKETTSQCGMTSGTLTPFGTDMAAFKWQENGCAGGEIIMRRTK